MDELKKRLFVDRALIYVGAIGTIGGIAALVFMLLGSLDFDISIVFFIAVCVFFCVRGVRLLGVDQEKFDFANQPEGQYHEDHSGESKYQTGRKRR